MVFGASLFSLIRFTESFEGGREAVEPSVSGFFKLQKSRTRKKHFLISSLLFFSNPSFILTK